MHYLVNIEGDHTYLWPTDAIPVGDTSKVLHVHRIVLCTCFSKNQISFSSYTVSLDLQKQNF